MLLRQESIVQVRRVLIGLLAGVRKVIVLEASKTGPRALLGFAACVLALGGASWLAPDRERTTSGGRSPLAH